jgi:hypothetical protein
MNQFKVINQFLIITLLFLVVGCSSSSKKGVKIDDLNKTSAALTNCENGTIKSYKPVEAPDYLTTLWTYECKKMLYACSYSIQGLACIEASMAN